MAGDSEELIDEYKKMNKTAFVLGYTGVIGSELVKTLLSSRIFAKVVLIGRRTVTYEDELYKDVEQVVVDFEHLDAHADAFKNFDVGYCCLGTPRFQSTAEEYYRVSHDYVVNSARLARTGGCTQFHLISSPYANKDSYFLATRIKGEDEEEIAAMNFESLFIYRPGLVLHKGPEKRSTVVVSSILLKPIIWAFPTFLSIPASTLAKAVLNKTLIRASEKVEILENRTMHFVAAELVVGS